MSIEFHRDFWIGRLSIMAGIGLCAIAWNDGIVFHPQLLESLKNSSGETLTVFALLLLGLGIAVCGVGLIERRSWARWSLEAFCWAALFSTVAAGVWIVPAGILQEAIWPGSLWHSPLFLLAELASFAWTLALAIPLVALLTLLRSHAPRDATRYLY